MTTKRWLVPFACFLPVIVGLGIWLCIAVERQRDAAIRTTDNGKLCQFSCALHSYHDAHGRFPPAYITDENGKPMHSWRVLILPFAGEDGLYGQYRFEEPWDGPNNSKLADRMPRFMRSSSHRDSKSPTTNFLAVTGPGTAWDPARRVSFEDIKDDRATTIMVAMNEGAGIHWMEPRDLDIRTMDFNVPSASGISAVYPTPQVAFADGSRRSLRPGFPSFSLKAMCTIAGGERIDPETLEWNGEMERK